MIPPYPPLVGLAPHMFMDHQISWRSDIPFGCSATVLVRLALSAPVAQYHQSCIHSAGGAAAAERSLDANRHDYLQNAHLLMHTFTSLDETVKPNSLSALALVVNFWNIQSLNLWNTLVPAPIAA